LIDIWQKYGQSATAYFFWPTLYVPVTSTCRLQNSGQLSLLSFSGKQINYRSAWLGLRWDNVVFTCVGLQLTVCDPIWWMMLCSSVKGVLLRAIHHLYL